MVKVGSENTSIYIPEIFVSSKSLRMEWFYDFFFLIAEYKI